VSQASKRADSGKTAYGVGITQAAHAVSYKQTTHIPVSEYHSRVDLCLSAVFCRM